MNVIDSIREEMVGGFMVLGLLSFFGLRAIVKGLRGKAWDGSEEEGTSKPWFVALGVMAQLPLIGYLCFLGSQGLLGF